MGTALVTLYWIGACCCFYIAGKKTGKRAGYWTGYWNGRYEGFAACEDMVMRRAKEHGYDVEKVGYDLLQ